MVFLATVEGGHRGGCCCSRHFRQVGIRYSVESSTALAFATTFAAVAFQRGGAAASAAAIMSRLVLPSERASRVSTTLTRMEAVGRAIAGALRPWTKA